MIAKIWRLAHMVLAAFATIFLLLVTLSGAILGTYFVKNNIQERYTSESQEIPLSVFLPNLRDSFPEVSRLQKSTTNNIQIEWIDEEGNEQHWIITPQTLQKVAQPSAKSKAEEWLTTFHRSLFMHEVGRWLVGVTTFLFLLIIFSGIVLIAQRQGQWKRWFGKVDRDSTAGYWHTQLGRWLLIPLLVSSITGTYLFMSRVGMFSSEAVVSTLDKEQSLQDKEQIPLEDFIVFQQIPLTDVVQLEFPLFEDDPDEYYTLTLRDRQLVINQITGEVEEENKFPLQALWAKTALEWHTGERTPLWAGILSLSSFMVTVFIITGWCITYKRLSIRFRKKKASEQDSSKAHYVLLYGSQKGTAEHYARLVAQQISEGDKERKVFVGELNSYTDYPEAKQIFLFIATYGKGEPPQNGDNFLNLLTATQQKHKIPCTVVGFGSSKFTYFCGFAQKVYDALQQQPWAEVNLPLYKVDRRNFDDFLQWITHWNSSNDIQLSKDVQYYQRKES